jgi:hypothetical protein
VRHISFGEGNYAATESMIRELLKDADPSVSLPAATDVEDDTPDVGSTTRETFLGSSKDVNYGGDGDYRAGTNAYSFPKDQPADSFALDGAWKVETQFATPEGEGGEIALDYHAAEVRIVVAGSGDIVVRRDDGSKETIAIDGTPRSYELVKQSDIAEGTLTLEVPAGIEVYSFTFG